MTMTERTSFIAAVHRRKTIHEAGHAVAAVSRGGRLVRFDVPFDDFEDKADAVGQPLVTHDSDPHDHAFITYAGVWVTARWMVEHEPDVGDLREALDYAIAEHSGPGSDAAKLRAAGVDLDAPHDEWDTELARLWPAVGRVADRFIDSGRIDHAEIAAILQGGRT